MTRPTSTDREQRPDPDQKVPVSSDAAKGRREPHTAQEARSEFKDLLEGSIQGRKERDEAERQMIERLKRMSEKSFLRFQDRGERSGVRLDGVLERLGEENRGKALKHFSAKTLALMGEARRRQEAASDALEQLLIRPEFGSRSVRTERDQEKMKGEREAGLKAEEKFQEKKKETAERESRAQQERELLPQAAFYRETLFAAEQMAKSGNMGEVAIARDMAEKAKTSLQELRQSYQDTTGKELTDAALNEAMKKAGDRLGGRDRLERFSGQVRMLNEYAKAVENANRLFSKMKANGGKAKDQEGHTQWMEARKKVQEIYGKLPPEEQNFASGKWKGDAIPREALQEEVQRMSTSFFENLQEHARAIKTDQSLFVEKKEEPIAPLPKEQKEKPSAPTVGAATPIVPVQPKAVSPSGNWSEQTFSAQASAQADEDDEVLSDVGRRMDREEEEDEISLGFVGKAEEHLEKDKSAGELKSVESFLHDPSTPEPGQQEEAADTDDSLEMVEEDAEVIIPVKNGLKKVGEKMGVEEPDIYRLKEQEDEDQEVVTTRSEQEQVTEWEKAKQYLKRVGEFFGLLKRSESVSQTPSSFERMNQAESYLRAIPAIQTEEERQDPSLMEAAAFLLENISEQEILGDSHGLVRPGSNLFLETGTRIFPDAKQLSSFTIQESVTSLNRLLESSEGPEKEDRGVFQEMTNALAEAGKTQDQTRILLELQTIRNFASGWLKDRFPSSEEWKKNPELARAVLEFVYRAEQWRQQILADQEREQGAVSESQETEISPESDRQAA